MTGPDYIIHEHLPNERLIRLLDDEVTGGEAAAIEIHLAGCDLCRERFTELRRVSSGFDSFISSLHLEYSASERQHLIQKLDRAAVKTPAAESRPNWRWVGWGAAAAAMLALGIWLLPQQRKVGEHVTPVTSHVFQAASSTFEVDGESFVALPYSNPDLPLSAPHIIQMQVPVSSLADAGIYVEPIGNSVSAPDRVVLANILLGLDGQPLGVHVLSAD